MSNKKNLSKQIQQILTDLNQLAFRIDQSETVSAIEADLLLAKLRIVYDLGLNLRSFSSEIAIPESEIIQTTIERVPELVKIIKTEVKIETENIPEKKQKTPFPYFTAVIPPPEQEDDVNFLPAPPAQIPEPIIERPEETVAPTKHEEPATVHVTRSKGIKDPSPREIVVKAEDAEELSKATIRKKTAVIQPTIETSIAKTGEKKKELPLEENIEKPLEKKPEERKSEIEELSEPVKPLKQGKQGSKKVAIMADKFEISGQSIYDKISNKPQPTTLASKLQEKAITDLRKAINLNHKILFIRELFQGDSKLYEKTIQAINETDSEEEVRKFINSNFSWDLEKESVKSFMEIVKRKFN